VSVTFESAARALGCHDAAEKEQEPGAAERSKEAAGFQAVRL